MIGYAFCGSFCTLKKSLSSLEALLSQGYDIQPIMSETVYSTDTRFFKAEEFRHRVEELTKKRIVHTIKEAEHFGPISPLEALIIAPCTGNTLAKLASGITDTAVTMAAKAHMRCDRPLLLALASNDAMSQNLKNIGTLITRRSLFVVPMCQDDPKGKPHSLVANFEFLTECFEKMLLGEQLRPIFI